jgi:DNA-binding CsgD family transcriptional regulator
MNAHERMLSLIGAVYTAAADETRWPAVLERLADEYRGGVAGLHYRTGREGHVRSARFVRLDPVLLEAIHTHFATRNPWVRATQSLFVPGLAIATEQVIPVAELRRTEYHDGVLRPAGVLHGFGACVFKRGDDILSFTVVRSKIGGPYEASELAPVHAIVPHLRRAVQVNARLSELQRTHAALGDSLEHLHHGVVIVGRGGRVVFANRAARAIVAQQDGLTIAADGLGALAAADHRRLRALIDDAVRTSSGEGLGSGGALTAARPSLKRPFIVLVAPLPLSHDEMSGLATVFVSDPEARFETTGEIAQRLYGLSPSESRLAQALVATGSLERAAEELCIARETARWHLKRIFRKTGTDRQQLLVRRLVDGPSRLALDAREQIKPTTDNAHHAL